MVARINVDLYGHGIRQVRSVSIAKTPAPNLYMHGVGTPMLYVHTNVTTHQATTPPQSCDTRVHLE